MSLRHSLSTAAVLSLTAACFAEPAATTNLYDAPPVIVTATRRARTPDTIPAPITILTAEQLRERGARHVIDALRDLAGLQVRSLNGNPAQAELSLRGFGENAHGRTLILRDGQRLNSPDLAGVNWLQLPISSVERIEILEGPQSVLYGDHAVGGVVNVITRDDARPARTEVAAQGGSHGAYGASLATRQATGQTRYTAGADWQTSDGYRRNGDYDSLNLRAGVDLPLTDTLRAALLGTYDHMANGLPGYLTREAMREDPRQTTSPDDEAETDTYNANLALRWFATPDQEVNTALIVNRREAASDFYSWMSFTETVVDSLTLTINHKLDGALLAKPARLLSGVDLYFDRLEADRFADAATSARLLNATVDKGSFGAFVNGEADLAEKLTLALGGRIELARYAADVVTPGGQTVVDDSKTHTVEALTASLLYRPASAVKLYASLSSLYRLPFLDEQISYYGYGSDTLYDDLDPERGLSGEVGGSWQFAPGWAAELNAYCMEMRDEIVYNPATSRNDNLDETRHQGISSALSWQRADLGMLRLRYTLTDARFSDGVNDGHDVPLVPRHHLSLTGQARLPLDLSLLATLNVCGNQYVGGDNANSAETLPSYATLDLALRYQSARRPDFTLLVGVDNVLDESYANVAYAGFQGTGYYPAPERTFKGALSYAF
jgi:iron complex outermembrane receptor protein